MDMGVQNDTHVHRPSSWLPVHTGMFSCLWVSRMMPVFMGRGQNQAPASTGRVGENTCTIMLFQQPVNMGALFSGASLEW